VTQPEIRAVVFDMDGLLVDSEPVQIEAWEAFLAQHGKSLSDDLLHRMYGLRVWDSAQLLIAELGLPLSVDEVVLARDALFFELLPGRLLPMPGSRETVQALFKLGYRLALATSGHRRYVDVVLRELGLVGAFEAEVTGEMVERGKPAPDIYSAAAKLLDLPPDACVALEDAPNGVVSAKEAGMICLAIPNQMTSGIDGFARADAVLSSLPEVIPWLGSRSSIPSV
jgi:HAD superfamily hydrolase (TIGR01509 family)